VLRVVCNMYMYVTMAIKLCWKKCHKKGYVVLGVHWNCRKRGTTLDSFNYQNTVVNLVYIQNKK